MSFTIILWKGWVGFAELFQLPRLQLSHKNMHENMTCMAELSHHHQRIIKNWVWQVKTWSLKIAKNYLIWISTLPNLCRVDFSNIWIFAPKLDLSILFNFGAKIQTFAIYIYPELTTYAFNVENEIFCVNFNNLWKVMEKSGKREKTYEAD